MTQALYAHMNNKKLKIKKKKNFLYPHHGCPVLLQKFHTAAEPT
jgi:hypothetical protein